MFEKYKTYAQDVVDGKIIACRYIRLACERYLADFERDDIYFDAKKVDRAEKFISMFKHFKGSSAGKPFLLEPWQQFILYNILGWRRTSDGCRRFSSSYIEIARKNGKTALLAALALVAMIEEPGAEVLLAANSADQASIAFKFCEAFVQGLDPNGAHMKAYQNRVMFKSRRSFVKVLSADSKRLDGYNCSFGLIDEYHAAPNSKVRDVLKSSMGQRSNPHLCTITTAGLNKVCPCYELRNTCIDILAGIKKDDAMFSVIYTLDDNDDWKDENCWIKSNPNLGITVSKNFLRDQITAAENNPSELVPTKVKNFNIWEDVSSIWMPDNYVLDAFDNDVDLDIFTPEDFVIVGVDLASVSDLTAAAYMKVVNADGDSNPLNAHYYFYVDYYLPAETLKRASYTTFYDWAKQGYLKVTNGNVTDFDYITRDIIEMSEHATIWKVAYDKFNATEWAIGATQQGLPLMVFGQKPSNFGPAVNVFERLLLTGKVHIHRNPITRYCINNVQLKEDICGNRMPIKATYAENGVAQHVQKIDGVMAMLMALGYYIAQPQFSNVIETWKADD